MSADLQSAFSFQARLGDRLLHILPHPRVEQKRLLSRLDVPDAALAAEVGVAVGELIRAHWVRFPPLQSLLPADSDLGRALRSSPYDLGSWATSRSASRCRPPRSSGTGPLRATGR